MPWSQLGIGGALLVVTIYVLRVNHADRAQYSELRQKADEQHEDDIAQLRRRISDLENEQHELRRMLEEERRRRWNAEDKAAYYRRLAGMTDDESDPAPGA